MPNTTTRKKKKKKKKNATRGISTNRINTEI